MISADPDIFVIERFLSDDEIDTLLELHERRMASMRDPQYCFS